jgi:hypothetical protein
MLKTMQSHRGPTSLTLNTPMQCSAKKVITRRLLTDESDVCSDRVWRRRLPKLLKTRDVVKENILTICYTLNF